MLLVGLVLQMDIIWQSSRANSTTLEGILADLQASRSDDGKTYVSHAAESLSPQMMIADLKGRLERLSVQVAEQQDG